MRQKILLIDDDSASRLGIVSYLTQKGFAVSLSSDLAKAEEDILAQRFDAVILGITRLGGKGPGFIRGVRVYDPYLPVVVITGGDQIEIAVDAVRCGADNVLGRPVDYAALSASLAGILKDAPPKLKQAARPHPKKMDEEKFFGTGHAARRFLDLAAGAAAESAPVLVTGETGTGKGLLARWLHQNGSRSSQPFAEVNCSGLRGDLLAAELFGAAHGAGSAKGSSRSGLVESAGNGTLLIDEIGDMDLTVQAELLSVLGSADRQHFGQGKEAADGFRLVCTSNLDLHALAGAGSFLPELLSRISATVLKIPPLRERLAELPDLVRHMLDGLRGPDTLITEEAIRVLKSYHWPGNLRELHNALEQGLILSHGGRLHPEHFNWLRPALRAREPRPLLTMSELKEQHIAAVLQRGSDVSRVASSLGISRSSIYRRLKQMRDGHC